MSDQDSKPQAQSKHAAYSAYAKAPSSLSQREKEAKLLVKAANSMQGLVTNWEDATPEDITVALEYNKNLWALFYDRAEKASNQGKLEQTILSLGQFVFQHSGKILEESDADRQQSMFDILISINRQIATGLFSRR